MTHRRLYWTVQILSWGALLGAFAGLAALSGGVQPGMTATELALSFLASWALLVTASDALRRLIRHRRWLARVPLALGLRVAAAALGLGVLVQLALAAVGTVGALLLGDPVTMDVARLPTLAGSAIVLGGMLLAWALAYVLVATASRLRSAEREALSLRAALAEAELAALRAQINPHFLFNALNTVRALIHREPDAARHAVTRLSTLLRETLTAGRHAEHPLATELDLARAYLDLEGLRFDERLVVEEDVEDAALGVLVPALLVLTFVENAVKHGVAPRLDGGTVRLTARVERGTLRLRVENPPPRDGSAAEGTGTGLRNARERLALLHGPAATLHTDLDGGPDANRPASVEVRLPVPLPAR